MKVIEHGIYDAAKNFFIELLPDLKQIARPELRSEIEKKYLESDVRHEWYIKGTSIEELENIQKFYNERYGGTAAKQLTVRRAAMPRIFVKQTVCMPSTTIKMNSRSLKIRTFPAHEKQGLP